jgi:DeoR/GlpR family transcriptional regulator of sugar metabolism
MVMYAVERQRWIVDRARAALAHLGNAESVFLDEGATTAALARILEPQRPLTVVTSSLPVAASWPPVRC